MGRRIIILLAYLIGVFIYSGYFSHLEAFGVDIDIALLQTRYKHGAESDNIVSPNIEIYAPLKGNFSLGLGIQYVPLSLDRKEMYGALGVNSDNDSKLLLHGFPAYATLRYNYKVDKSWGVVAGVKGGLVYGDKVYESNVAQYSSDICQDSACRISNTLKVSGQQIIGGSVGVWYKNLALTMGYDYLSFRNWNNNNIYIQRYDNGNPQQESGRDYIDSYASHVRGKINMLYLKVSYLFSYES